MHEPAVGRVLPRPGGLLLLVGLGLVTWAGGAAVLAAGLTWASEPVAVVLHAVVLPVWAALVAWFWFTRLGRWGPADSAVILCGVGVVIDAFILARAARDGVHLVELRPALWLPVLAVAPVAFLVGTMVSVPHTVEVRALIEGFQPDVFAALVEPELVRLHPGVLDLSIAEPGQPEPWGRGCVVDLTLDRGTLREVVTECDPPRSFATEVVASSVPIEQLGSRIALERVDEGVVVTWTARMQVRAFPISGLVARRAARELAHDLAEHLDGLHEVVAEARRRAAERRAWLGPLGAPTVAVAGRAWRSAS